MKQVEAWRMYDLAFAYLTTLQWQKAADCFVKVEAGSEWSKGMYHYLIGSCYYELYIETKDSEYARKADERLSRVSAETGKKKVMGKELPMELFIRRKCAKWQTRCGKGMVQGITVSPIMEMCHIYNLWKKMTNELRVECQGLVQRHGSLEDSQDDQLTRQLLTAALQRHMKDWKAFDSIAPATSNTRATFTDIPHAETWAIPYAYHEQAACYWARDGMSAAAEIRSWLEKVKHFGESEFEDALSMKLTTAQQALAEKV